MYVLLHFSWLGSFCFCACCHWAIAHQREPLQMCVPSVTHEQSWQGTVPELWHELAQEPHTATMVLVLAMLASCVLCCSPPSPRHKYKWSCGLILCVRDSWNVFWNQKKLAHSNEHLCCLHLCSLHQSELCEVCCGLQACFTGVDEIS